MVETSKEYVLNMYMKYTPWERLYYYLDTEKRELLYDWLVEDIKEWDSEDDWLKEKIQSICDTSNQKITGEKK